MVWRRACLICVYKKVGKGNAGRNAAEGFLLVHYFFPFGTVTGLRYNQNQNIIDPGVLDLDNSVVSVMAPNAFITHSMK
jgi:hypothetical protein